MGKLFKTMWFALAVLLTVSAILLISDLENRKARSVNEKERFPSIAILQISSSMLLDTHISGIVDKLTERGYVAPGQTNLRHFNAMGDLSMASMMAQEVLNGSYQMAITSSTVMMQAFAKAMVRKSLILWFRSVRLF